MTPSDWTRGDPADVAVAFSDRGALLAEVLSVFSLGRPEWHDDAACRGSSLDFTSRDGSERSQCFELCGRCPVRVECLRWAFEIDDRVAILGGTDWPARRAMTVARGADAAGGVET